ncbi:MAG: sugar ABC transporter substrate-binding protein [Chloroflexi bacterium]|nr:sugar ABC transporter substrate-binding protein [Chloroflexota bacterium]
MTNNSSKCTLIITIVLLTIGLAACNAAIPPSRTAKPDTNDEQVNLRFTIWSGNEAHLTMLNKFAETYRESHPNVTVQFDTIPTGDYTDKVTIQLAGSNPPDGGWIVERSAPTFIAAEVLVDLGPVLRQIPGYDMADLSESALLLWKKEDAIYGIPFSTSPFLILYNRDLFEIASIETPDELLTQDQWTWKALAEAAKRIADVTPSGIYGFESVDAAVYDKGFWLTLVPIMWAYGGDAWDSEGTQCLFNSDRSIAAIRLYHDMVFADKSAVPPGEQADFFSGQSAITIAQLSRVAKLQDVTFAWGVVPLPSGPNGEASVIGQAALAVFEASEHKDQAIDFVAFMTNKENVLTMAEFFPPARDSVLESEAFLKANPLVDPDSMEQSVVAAIQSGRVLPNHVEFPNIDMITHIEFKNLWVPDADLQAVLSNICESIDPFLTK